jgi:hypothetical protein
MPQYVIGECPSVCGLQLYRGDMRKLDCAGLLSVNHRVRGHPRS